MVSIAWSCDGMGGASVADRMIVYASVRTGNRRSHLEKAFLLLPQASWSQGNNENCFIGPSSKRFAYLWHATYACLPASFAQDRPNGTQGVPVVWHTSVCLFCPPSCPCLPSAGPHNERPKRAARPVFLSPHR